MPERETVLDKVRKLRRVAERTTNRHEAENALLLAQRLMAEADLVEADADEAPEDSDVDGLAADQTGRAVAWRVALANAVAPNFRCRFYLDRQVEAADGGRSTVLRFVGRRRDATVAVEVYQQAVHVASRLAAAHVEVRRREQRWGLSAVDARMLGTSFLKGFASGLDGRFAAQRQEHQEWALVLVPEAAVDQKYNDLLGPDRSTWRASASRIETGAWGAGFEAGKGFDGQAAGRPGLDRPRRALPE